MHSLLDAKVLRVPHAGGAVTAVFYYGLRVLVFESLGFACSERVALGLYAPATPV